MRVLPYVARPFVGLLPLLGGVGGPARRSLGEGGLVAQSVEQRPFKPLVLGSSPSQPTTSKTPLDSSPGLTTTPFDGRWQHASLDSPRSSNSAHISCGNLWVRSG